MKAFNLGADVVVPMARLSEMVKFVETRVIVNERDNGGAMTEIVKTETIADEVEAREAVVEIVKEEAYIRDSGPLLLGMFSLFSWAILIFFLCCRDR